MKKALLLGLGLAVAVISTPLASAADTGDKTEKKKSRLTEEQRKLRKEMVEKYDTNKNGKLDKEERAKISKEDQDKPTQAGLGANGKRAAKKAPSQ